MPLGCGLPYHSLPLQLPISKLLHLLHLLVEVSILFIKMIHGRIQYSTQLLPFYPYYSLEFEYFLMTCSINQYPGYYGTSVDGINWTTSPIPKLGHAATFSSASFNEKSQQLVVAGQNGILATVSTSPSSFPSFPLLIGSV